MHFFPPLSLGLWLKKETETSSNSPAATRMMENRNKWDWGRDGCQLGSVCGERGCTVHLGVRRSRLCSLAGTQMSIPVPARAGALPRVAPARPLCNLQL